MLKFEEFNIDTFPAEECTIPLKINSNFFRAEKLKSVLLYDNKEDMLFIKNLYPCLRSKDGEDFFGFCDEKESEFYKPGNRYFVKGLSECEELAVIVGELLN